MELFRVTQKINSKDYVLLRSCNGQAAVACVFNHNTWEAEAYLYLRPPWPIEHVPGQRRSCMVFPLCVFLHNFVNSFSKDK